MKDELIKLLCLKSVNISDEEIYTLVSGRKSNFYINCKPTILDPYGAYLIGNLMHQAIDVSGNRSPAKAVGGLETGAIPIAEAIATVSHYEKRPIKAFWIRKTQKDHGLIKWIEGDVQQGDGVVIIDDVATTGGSTIAAINRAREEGLKIIKCIILVDRQEGGLDTIRKHLPDVPDPIAIITKTEIFEVYDRIKSAQH